MIRFDPTYLPREVWGQFEVLDALHRERVAEAEAQPEPPPKVPPLSSHPNAVKRAVAELDERIAAAPQWDTQWLSHLENERDWHRDHGEFYADDWATVRAHRSEQKRATAAQERKANREREQAEDRAVEQR